LMLRTPAAGPGLEASSSPRSCCYCCCNSCSVAFLLLLLQMTMTLLLLGASLLERLAEWKQLSVESPLAQVFPSDPRRTPSIDGLHWDCTSLRRRQTLGEACSPSIRSAQSVPRCHPISEGCTSCLHYSHSHHRVLVCLGSRKCSWRFEFETLGC